VKLKSIDVEKVARAIEADAGEALPGLRKSLSQAKRGQLAVARKRGRPAGTTKTDAKEPVKLRLDPDVLEALRATGPGWQTRVNDTLRANLILAGKLDQQ